MSFGRKEKTLSFGKWAYGQNVVDPRHEIRDGQVYTSLDMMLDVKRRRPGSLGITSAITGDFRGLWSFLDTSESDILLAVVSGKLYSVNESTGATTELYDMGGSGEAWFGDYKSHCWIANGAANVKYDGTTAYQIGITAPESGAAAAAGTGGDLVAGIYKVKIGYARKVGGINRLYSQGADLGMVTVGASGTVVITGIPLSSDPQVNNIVVWMTDAGAAVYYYYGETGDNTTTAITISGTTTRSTALTYTVDASLNFVPAAFSFILPLQNYLFGVIDDTVYRSIKASTVYDMERFNTQATGNKHTYPYRIVSIHGLPSDEDGVENLIVNTDQGILVVPKCDLSAGFDHASKRLWFKYPRTVVESNGQLIGLTQDGVRIFDGTKMLDYDLSRDVKEQINDIYAGAGVDNMPCGQIVHRKNRTEYHLCYKDLSVGARTNNRRLVLNIDLIQYLPNQKMIAPWETWSNSANYLDVKTDGTLWAAQSKAPESVIYKEREDRMIDANIYIADTLEVGKVPQVQVVSKTIIPNIMGKCSFGPARVLVQCTKECTVKFYMVSEEFDNSSSSTVDPVRTGFILGVAKLGVDRLSSTDPILRIVKLSDNMKAYGVYAVFEQSLEDKELAVLEIGLNAIIERSRFV